MNKDLIWDEVKDLIDNLPVRVRVVFINDVVSGWSDVIGFPASSYAESDGGPFLKTDAKTIEIDPIEMRWIGRLVPEKRFDHSLNVRDRLERAGIEFEMRNEIFSMDLGNLPGWPSHL